MCPGPSRGFGPRGRCWLPAGGARPRPRTRGRGSSGPPERMTRRARSVPATAARSHSCRALPLRGSSPVTNPVNHLRGRPAGLTLPSAGCLLRPQSALWPGPCPASVGPSRLRPGSGPPPIGAARRLGPRSRRGGLSPASDAGAERCAARAVFSALLCGGAQGGVCSALVAPGESRCSETAAGPGAQPPASVRGAPGLGVGTARSVLGPWGPLLLRPLGRTPWGVTVSRAPSIGQCPWLCPPVYTPVGRTRPQPPDPQPPSLPTPRPGRRSGGGGQARSDPGRA